MKTLITITIVAIGLLGIFLFGDYFLDGTRLRFSEGYKFRCSEPQLIGAIEQFRVQNPRYLLPKEEYLPNGIKVHLPYISRDTNLHQYYLYLYDSVKNQIINFRIRYQDSASCELYFNV